MIVWYVVPNSCVDHSWPGTAGVMGDFFRHAHHFVFCVDVLDLVAHLCAGACEQVPTQVAVPTRVACLLSET